MTIDATVGGPSSNSYITLPNSLLYFEGRFGNSGYIDATVEDREKLLRTATLFLDSRVDWVGYPKDRTTPQALQWPRVDSLDTTTALDILGGAIPQDLKNAQCEMALYIVDNGEPVDAVDLDSIKVGSLTIDFNEFLSRNLVPDQVWAMVSHLGFRISPVPMLKSVSLCR